MVGICRYAPFFSKASNTDVYLSESVKINDDKREHLKSFCYSNKICEIYDFEQTISSGYYTLINIGAIFGLL